MARVARTARPAAGATAPVVVQVGLTGGSAVRAGLAVARVVHGTHGTASAGAAGGPESPGVARPYGAGAAPAVAHGVAVACVGQTGVRAVRAARHVPYATLHTVLRPRAPACAP